MGLVLGPLCPAWGRSPGIFEDQGLGQSRAKKIPQHHLVWYHCAQHGNVTLRVGCDLGRCWRDTGVQRYRGEEKTDWEVNVERDQLCCSLSALV